MTKWIQYSTFRFTHRTGGVDKGFAACFGLEEWHVEASHHKNEDRAHAGRATGRVEVVCFVVAVLFMTCRQLVRGLEEELSKCAAQRVVKLVFRLLVWKERYLSSIDWELIRVCVDGLVGPLWGVKVLDNELLVYKQSSVGMSSSEMVLNELGSSSMRVEAMRVDPKDAAEHNCCNEYRTSGPRTSRIDPRRRVATHRVARHSKAFLEYCTE